ncbi:MAG: O-acetyl-ADP-ribose deacetylase [Sporichthya sp.]|nr:O-acetyl-ADP-ribose deacetylase [Sporichthya sp.]MBA3742444.1 O-acetyl-ADP-ribose deacetylase [Sporichthya sp.]
MPDVTVMLGDITTQHVDAVVNAANNGMRGGGGVDGAIHRAGGPAVLEDCIERFPRGLATGDAGWTTAGAMPAQWVIHTVGPNYRAGQRDRALLVSCYRRCLAIADELGAETVAFPLISAGVYGWPHEDAVRVAIETLRATPSTAQEARLVAFGRETLITARSVFREVPRPSVSQPIDLPPTRAKLHAFAFERAKDPASVTEAKFGGVFIGRPTADPQ